jgi:hypothetical protein
MIMCIYYNTTVNTIYIMFDKQVQLVEIIYNKYNITFMHMHCAWPVSTKPKHSDIVARN